jgi:rRNA maturation endonuclease Nob1
MMVDFETGADYFRKWFCYACKTAFQRSIFRVPRKCPVCGSPRIGSIPSYKPENKQKGGEKE